VFEGIDAPVWDAAPSATDKVPSRSAMHSQPLRVSLPPGLPAVVAPVAMQSLAGQAENKSQQ
jgi:putative proteasome-type protease